MCTSKWLAPVMAMASEARILVLFGTKVRNYWGTTMPGVPAGFGKRRSGLTTLEVIESNSYIDERDGMRRIAMYLPHPSASGEKGETLSIAGIYGESFLGFTQDVISGKSSVPSTTGELHSLFSC
jgi:hypothetical protein